MRTIKSFVLRTGRVTKRQQYALDTWLDDYELPKGKRWDFSAIFNRTAPVWVEIGFGMGNSLLKMAQTQPEINFIGIEVHRAGVGSLVAALYEQNITNVRLVVKDAVEVFTNEFSSNSLAGVQIFFPDPWHKKRHKKRRLIQPAFVKLLTDRLQPHGFVHCATDWEDYAVQMRAIFSAETSLYNEMPDGGFVPQHVKHRPLTKFEQRGVRLGHGVWDLIYRKEACANSAEVIES